jgi:hypothetical protein
MSTSNGALALSRHKFAAVAGLVLLLVAVAGVLAMPASASPGSKTNCVDDSSVSYKQCVTMNYNVMTSGGVNYVEVSSYQVVWTSLGATGVSIYNGVVRIGVFGPTTTGKMDAANSTYNVPTITLGHAYTYVPSWSGDYVNVSGSYWFQCGNADATIQHGTSTWDLNPSNQDVCEGTPQIPNFWA